MNIRTTIISSLFITIFTQGAKAQNVFNEMQYAKDRTVFTLNAPSAATLRIYDKADADKAAKTIKMKNIGGNKWQATVKGDLNGLFYTFDTGNGECPGMFAKAVGVNGNRAAIVNMATTNPDGWASDKRPDISSPTDLVIYELHHRDFSIDPSSRLRYGGKYLALTEQRATDYLKRLGVNAIHILPSFDFASIDESKPSIPQYNWGYDPKNYNVPEGSYATNPFLPETRIKEFKMMVQALHKAGIRVILDVVYNHTFDIENSNFQRIYPDYFYRKTADGKYSDGSGCGNETASEKPLMREFMLESVKYWIQEYHIDGFRFDLMGVHDIETMNLIRKEVNKIDPSIYIYGEGWSAGECALPTDMLATKANTKRLDGIGAFCDDMRDALRGPFNDDAKGGFLAGAADMEESIKFGIAGAISHPQIDMTKVNYSKEAWANSPAQMISYVSCHDDMCLTDRLRASVPGIKEDELIRLDLLAQTAVFTSQGVPFILSGEEMLRDKKGVHNSYNSPDGINHLDWDNLTKYPQVFNYYSGLIRLRLEHPAFRMGNADDVRKHLEFLDSPKGTVTFRLKNHAGGDQWKDIIVILNSSKSIQRIDIPKGCYTIVAEKGMVNKNGIREIDAAYIDAAPQSAMILHI